MLHLVGADETPKLVVGIVRDAVYEDLIEDAKQARLFYYLPLAQRSALGQTLHVRTTTEPTTWLGSVRSELSALDPQLPLFHVTTMKTMRDLSLAPQRIAMSLVTFSGLLTIVLAALGLYGAMSQEVIGRKREIGIRLAVGAQRQEVVSMIVREGMKLAGVGIAAGLAGALAITRVIRNLLFGVGTADPVTFALLVLLSMAVALLATWVPARRAAKVDPMEALRCE